MSGEELPIPQLFGPHLALGNQVTPTPGLCPSHTSHPGTGHLGAPPQDSPRTRAASGQTTIPPPHSGAPGYPRPQPRTASVQATPQLPRALGAQPGWHQEGPSCTWEVAPASRSVLLCERGPQPPPGTAFKAAALHPSPQASPPAQALNGLSLSFSVMRTRELTPEQEGRQKALRVQRRGQAAGGGTVCPAGWVPGLCPSPAMTLAASTFGATAPGQPRLCCPTPRSWSGHPGLLLMGRGARGRAGGRAAKAALC